MPKKKRGPVPVRGPGQGRRYLMDNYIFPCNGGGEPGSCKSGHVYLLFLENGQSVTRTRQAVYYKFGFVPVLSHICSLVMRLKQHMISYTNDSSKQSVHTICQEGFLEHYQPPTATLAVPTLVDPQSEASVSPTPTSVPAPSTSGSVFESVPSISAATCSGYPLIPSHTDLGSSSSGHYPAFKRLGAEEEDNPQKRVAVLQFSCLLDHEYATSGPGSERLLAVPASHTVFENCQSACDESDGTDISHTVKDVLETLLSSVERKVAQYEHGVVPGASGDRSSSEQTGSVQYENDGGSIQKELSEWAAKSPLYLYYLQRDPEKTDSRSIKRNRKNRLQEAVQKEKSTERKQRHRKPKRPCSCSAARKKRKPWIGVDSEQSLTVWDRESESQVTAEYDSDGGSRKDQDRKHGYQSTERDKKAARKQLRHTPGYCPTAYVEPITPDCPMSGYESEGMESHDSQLLPEVKIEVDMADDMSHYWMATHHEQNPESDDDLNQPAAVPIDRMSSPPAVREDSTRVAQALCAYQAQPGFNAEGEESDGSRESVTRQPRKSNTHSALKVVCLDVRSRGYLGRVPDITEMAALVSNGLASIPAEANDKGVSYFKKSDSASQFHQCLQRYFPRLIPGSYCFSTSSRGQNMVEIPNGQMLTVQALKRILNHRRLYIVPFALRAEEQAAEQSYGDVPTVRDFTLQGGASLFSPPFQVFPEPTSPIDEKPDFPEPTSPIDEKPDFDLQDPMPQMMEDAADRVVQQSDLQTSSEVTVHVKAEPVSDSETLTNSGHVLQQSRTYVGGEAAESGHVPPPPVLENQTFTDLVLGLRPVPPDNKRILLNIKKDDFLCDTRRGFFRKGVDLRRPTSVKFVGMPDVDTGALSAQFRVELVRHIRDSEIFTGPEDSKMLVFSIQCMQDELYHQYGTMLAYIIAHGGPYPEFFSDELYSLLLGDHVDFTARDIPIPSIRTRVEQVQAAETEEDYAEAVQRIEDLVLLTGSKPTTLAGRQTLVDHIVHFMCCHLMEKPLSQFRDGLRELGVMSLVERNRESGRGFFLPGVEPHVNVETLRDLWTCDIDGTSDSGLEEIRIHGYFLDLLLDLDENQLKQLLKFSTGQDSIPAKGFHRPPRLTFNHQGHTPTANTDTLELCLPVTESAETFNAAMLSALETVSSDFVQGSTGHLSADC